MPNRAFFLLLMLAGLLLSACVTADPVDDSIPPTVAPSFSLDARYTFASTADGVTVAYTLDYPNGWHVAPLPDEGRLVISREPQDAAPEFPERDNITLVVATPDQDQRDLETYALETQAPSKNRIDAEDATDPGVDGVIVETRRVDGKRALRLLERTNSTEHLSYIVELAPGIYLTMHSYVQIASADNLLLAADAALRSITVVSVTVAAAN